MTASVSIAPLVDVTLAEATTNFLARRDLDADTLRSYAQTTRQLRRAAGDTVLLGRLTAEQTAAVFTAAWDRAAPRTWNRHRAALRSFSTWAASPGRSWVTTDLTALIARRPEPRDRTRAIDRTTIAALLDDRGVPLRDKTLRKLLYESAARADEVLSLNIEDLDLDNKRGRVTGKGGTLRWIHWRSSTTRLLPRLIGERTSGPLLLADRRPAPARTPAAADLCPHTGRGRLSYERAEYLFKQDTKQHDPRRRGYALHQLRHSRLTHLAEDGWSAPVLMALSGHENIRNLAIYTSVTAEAVGAALAAQDPGRRHR
ncbi:tyrosine-type recombinase/integrase [Actinomadura kijaniata]|uniref:tyrosine-type recombinase/integrase n=1 Tax=Actinomadura kijaniata TaxID=46161 RepID=UPI00082A7B40|nr:site-specific integrase [Actinomadura kijaniata]